MVRDFRLNFRHKLLLAFITLTSASSGVAIALGWMAVSAVPAHLNEAVMTVGAMQAVRRIDPADVVRLAAHDQATRRDSPEYARLTALLSDMVAAAAYEEDSNFRPWDGFVTILVKDDTGNIARAIASSKRELEDRLIELSDEPAMAAAWAGPTSDPKPREGTSGRIQSAYVPIKDSDGKAVGILTVGMPAVTIDLATLTTGLLAALALLIVVGLSAVAASVMAWRLNRPIRRLHRGMQAVESGNLDVSLPTPDTVLWRDELADLTVRFNAMVAHLRDRAALRKSLEIASQVQRNLLPDQPPAAVGLDIAADCEFCDETGGDYYDYITLAPTNGGSTGRLGIVIGDVSGHGISSALLMASVRGVLRSHAPYRTDPGQLLNAVNEHVMGDDQPNRFITLLYAVVDPSARLLTYASAGHDPALLIRKSGESIELSATGYPLGIETQTNYPTSAPHRLESGDVVILTTDGVREAADPSGEFYGTARVAEVVRQSARKRHDARSILRDLIADVGRHRGTEPSRDDLTVMVIRVT